MKVETGTKRISASIQPRKGRNFQLVYRIDGERHEQTLKTKDETAAFLQAEKLIKQLKIENITGITLGELKKEWLKYNINKSEWYKKDIEKHFQPFVEYFKDCVANCKSSKTLGQNSF